MSLTLMKIAETNSTITLGWTPPAGVGGYVLYAAGKVVSVATANLKDGSPRTSAKFSKTNPGPPFEVIAVKYPPALAWDRYPEEAPPPPPTDYIDQISDLDAVFLPTYTLAGSITQGVTNPIGLGGGVYEINDDAGSGYRFVATSSMAAPWDSSTKTCLAVRDRRPGVGQFEQWDFKYRYPLADNPSFSTGFFAGAIFEFGHTQTNSGLKLDFDGRNVSGALGHYLGVPKAPWGVGDFDYISIVDYTTFMNQRGHDYVLTARIRYNPDSTGYVQVIIDGRTIIDQFRPMRPNTSEIPKIQFGYYSDRTAAKNGSEIRNLNYQYNV